MQCYTAEENVFLPSAGDQFDRRIHDTCNCYPSWWNCRCYSYSSVTNPFFTFTSPCTPSIGCTFLDSSHHSGIYDPTGTKHRLINNRACVSPLYFSVHMTTSWKRGTEQDAGFDLFWLPGHLPQREGRGKKLKWNISCYSFPQQSSACGIHWHRRSKEECQITGD